MPPESLARYTCQFWHDSSLSMQQLQRGINALKSRRPLLALVNFVVSHTKQKPPPPLQPYCSHNQTLLFEESFSSNVTCVRGVSWYVIRAKLPYICIPTIISSTAVTRLITIAENIKAIACQNNCARRSLSTHPSPLLRQY